ncbi:MAG: hypothetical protein ABIK86_01675 [candidate division WOR-3 bacterium]
MLEVVVFSIITVILPVVAMLMLFRWLPKQRFTVGGPFQKLTVRASGAVAGWFVTFLVLVQSVLVPSVRRAGRDFEVYSVRGEIVHKDGSPDEASYVAMVNPPSPGSFDGGQLIIDGVLVDKSGAITTTLTLEREGGWRVSVPLIDGQQGVKFKGKEIDIGKRTFICAQKKMDGQTVTPVED